MEWFLIIFLVVLVLHYRIKANKVYSDLKQSENERLAWIEEAEDWHNKYLDLKVVHSRVTDRKRGSDGRFIKKGNA